MEILQWKSANVCNGTKIKPKINPWSSMDILGSHHNTGQNILMFLYEKLETQSVFYTSTKPNEGTSARNLTDNANGPNHFLLIPIRLGFIKIVSSEIHCYSLKKSAVLVNTRSTIEQILVADWVLLSFSGPLEKYKHTYY